MKLDWNIVFIIVIALGMVFFVSMMISMMIDTDYYVKAMNKACTDLDMRLHRGDEFDYCIDDKNTVHPVELQCEGFFHKKTCKAIILN